MPDRCLPLLREQRTHYQNHAAEYGTELHRTFDSFSHLLPLIAENVLDIGCGMAGIDVLLGNHFPHADLWLLDKDGTSQTINCGFNERADDFAHYHDFIGAFELLSANGIDLNRVRPVDIGSAEFPERDFDVVISLLSWGFHYPIDTYAPIVRPGGVIIADIRKNTNGLHKLQKYGRISVVHDARKYHRVVVAC